MRIRVETLVVVALVALVAVAGLALASAADPVTGEMEGAKLYPSSAIEWKPGPASLPKGASFAVLEGDPAAEGPFVFRVKVPAGYRVPLHTHPKVERVTVISGTFHVGMADKFDEKLAKPMPAGTYGYWPAGMKHFAFVEEETVVQFHGMGPWTIVYVDPSEDPRNQKN